MRAQSASLVFFSTVYSIGYPLTIASSEVTDGDFDSTSPVSMGWILPWETFCDSVTMNSRTSFWSFAGRACTFPGYCASSCSVMKVIISMMSRMVKRSRKDLLTSSHMTPQNILCSAKAEIASNSVSSVLKTRTWPLVGRTS